MQYFKINKKCIDTVEEPRLSGLTGTKGKPDNRKFGYMGNKNKTNPQISEFEFITIKKHVYIKIT